MKKILSGIAIIIITAIVIVGIWILLSKQGGNRYPITDTTFGVTFSTMYASSLGLDWKEVYVAALDDLEVRAFRIPVYWDEIEQEQGVVWLDDVKWMLDEAEQRDAEIILVIGRRVPRWPECHQPDWTSEYSEVEIQDAEITMLETVVFELHEYSAISYWQVQNEPFLTVFGECPRPDNDFIAETVQTVRKLDPTRKIIVTDSGELGTWVSSASLADVLGISMYRVTWNKYLGYLYYPLPPGFYTYRSGIIDSFVDDVIVTELQVEPWVSDGILDTTLTEQYRSMNVDRFRSNIDYVRRTDFSEVYLWGIEWWYWLKEFQNEDGMWEASRSLF